MSEVPTKKKIVEIGTEHIVHIDKLFGPAVAREIRVWLNWEPWQWVVERNDSHMHGDDWVEMWTEVARFDADLPDDPEVNNV